MPEGLLQNLLAGLLVGAIASAIAAIIATLVNRAANKTIGSTRYYTGAVIVGFALYQILIIVTAPTKSGIFPNAVLQKSSPAAATGLDAPFFAPPESHLESFPLQLKAAVERLSSEDQAVVNESFSFLSFAVAMDLVERDPNSFDKKTTLDLATMSFTRLYRFAQNQGSSMTLRKYVELAAEVRKQKPEWWAQYKAASQK